MQASSTAHQQDEHHLESPVAKPEPNQSELERNSSSNEEIENGEDVIWVEWEHGGELKRERKQPGSSWR